METLQTNYGFRSPRASADSCGADSANIVRQALLIQTRVGSMSALEYMKAHDIGGAIITRVLTGRCVRQEDVNALANRRSRHPVQAMSA